MPADRRGQSINSERFEFSVPGLDVPPSNRACSQREMNPPERRSEGQEPQTTKEKEMIGNLVRFLFLRPKVSSSEFLLHLSLLG